MEQSDQTKKSREPTPYELATLASRISPRLCIDDPEAAVAAAETLITHASILIRRDEDQLNATVQQYREEMRQYREATIDWFQGVKGITAEGRRDRATQQFANFIRQGAPPSEKEKLALYKDRGFSPEEFDLLQHLFREWKRQPKRSKGRQGRRIRSDDRRVRTPSIRGSEEKSPKRS